MSCSSFGNVGFRLPLQAQRILLCRDLNILRLYTRHRNLENKALWRLKQIRRYSSTAETSRHAGSYIIFIVVYCSLIDFISFVNICKFSSREIIL